MVWRRLAWGVAFGFVGLWAAVSLSWPLGLDQGIFAWVGDAMLRGGLPYVDAWEHKGPATHALYALAQAAFGRHAWSVRALDLCALAVGALAIGLLGRRIGGSQVGLGSALLLVLLYASGGYWHGAQPDGFASMGLLAAAALVVRRPPRVRAWLAAGALCGACALLKPFFLAWLLLLIAWAALSHGRRSAVRLGSIAACGALAVIGWVLLVYAFRGGLADLVEVQLVYNTTLHRNAYLSLAPGDIARAIAAYFAQPWAALALAFTGTWLWQQRHQARAEAVLLIGWCAFALAAVVAQNQYFAYHWLPLQAPLVLGTALGVRSAWGEEGGARAWQRASAAVLALAALALAVREPLAQVRSWHGSSAEEYARNFGMGTFSSATSERIAQHVAASTQPSDRILVWGYECGIYFLADRAASTRFGFLYPLIRGGGTELEERYIAEFLRDLVESPPAYVLRFAQQLGPLPDANRRMLAIFDATLARCYEPDPALQADRLEAWRRVPDRRGC